MTMTFLGLVHLWPGTPTAADIEEQRRTGAGPAALLDKVRQLPNNLPSTARLVTSYMIGSPDLVTVFVVEVESFADLQWINSYYNGWFWFDWHPTQVVPRG